MVKELTVAQILAETLKRHGTSRVYGLIGTTVLDFVDALYEYSSDINFITTRHEQVAVSAADAEARITGRAGVAVVHAGPGFLNSIIALGIAHKDRVPLLLITGGVRRRLKGTNAWLEIDQESIAKSVSKYYKRIRSPDEILVALKEAFESIYKPPRSVAIIEIPEDLWPQKIQVREDFLDDMRFLFHDENVPMTIIENIIDKFVKSKKPLIYACGELVIQGRFSQEALVNVAERLGSYVVVSGNARGSCPEDHPKCLGRIGFGGGNIIADKAFQSSDFVLVLGNEFDDLHTYGYTMLPSGDVIVISKDPIVFERPNYYEIIEHDPISFLKTLSKVVKERNIRISKEDWDHEIDKYKKLWSEMLNDALSRKYENKVNPSLFFKELDNALPRDRIITAGQGTHIIYVYNYVKIYLPNSFLASTNLGAMSYAFPAAIGAKLAMPDKEVIAVTGDGEFMMTAHDLETLKRENIPIKVIVVNDNSYRVLYLRQIIQKNSRVYETLLTNPDFVKFAESFGIKGFRVEKDSEIKSCIETIINLKEPALVELVIDRNDLPPLNLDNTLKMSMV